MADLQDSKQLPILLPLTIEDALIVVKELRLRYLWIDRYCIPQGGKEKHDQVQNMDQIYRDAEVTIIALAGNNPSFGLPGVGKTSRIPQRKVVLEILPLFRHSLPLGILCRNQHRLRVDGLTRKG